MGFGKWISVKDRLPTENGDVLVCIGERKHEKIEMYYYCGDNMWETGQYMADTEFCGITHWMPLPQAPKGDRL